MVSVLSKQWNNNHCSIMRCCAVYLMPDPHSTERRRRSKNRPLHPVTPTGWPRRRSGHRIGQATTPKHVPCTGDGSHPPRGPCMPPAGHNRSAAGCEATGGTGRIVRAIAPHTDSRGGTLSARCREGTCNTGRAGTGQVPSSALFCGDNRQTHLGGRGPPGCSGERDRWLPLGSDDLNARTRV